MEGGSKKRKPVDEPKFKQITITKIEITEYYKEFVFKKLQMNAIIDDVNNIRHSQKSDGSLPSYDIIINEQLQLKKIELGKTFEEMFMKERKSGLMVNSVFSNNSIN